MKPLRHALFGLALVAPLAAGCGGLQKPDARVGPVAITERSEQGVRVEVPLVLQNPNDTPLPIRETRYTVTLGERSFRFTDKAAATMPAGGTQTLTLPAAFALRPAGQPYTVRGTVVYEPPGEVRRIFTDSGLPLPSVGFSARGALPGDAP